MKRQAMKYKYYNFTELHDQSIKRHPCLLKKHFITLSSSRGSNENPQQFNKVLRRFSGILTPDTQHRATHGRGSFGETWHTGRINSVPSEQRNNLRESVVVIGKSSFMAQPKILTVRSLHKRTINLEDTDSTRRWSLVTDSGDMGPRTFLTARLPSVFPGNELTILPNNPPEVYSPFFPSLKFNASFTGLAVRWRSFLAGELKILAKLAVEEDWYGMIGLGPGLTPAGDDYLSGFAAGIRVGGRRWEFRPNYSRTSWLSGDMLKDALNGLVWRRAKDLLKALSGNSYIRVEDCAGEVERWGHTSGRAWLAGLGDALLKSAG